MYGGAAGGGKSVALLMDALLYVDNPNYRGLLARRTLQQLQKPLALIDMSHEWLAGKAQWKEQLKRWVFPSGATLDFTYLDAPRDHENHQGAAYHYFACDEATQLRAKHYTYLFSRVRRSAGDAIPLRVRAATNPGGPSHEFFKNRFFVEKDPTRAFIASSLEDNPHLDRDAYERELKQLGGVEYRQLRHGDWSVDPEGGIFNVNWFTWMPLAEYPAKFDRVFIVGDTAETVKETSAFTVFQAWGYVKQTNRLYLFDQVRDKWEVPDLRAAAKEFIDHVRASKRGPLTSVEIEDLSSGKGLNQALKRLGGIPLKPISRVGTGTKIDRANAVKNYSTSAVLPADAHYTAELKRELVVFGSESGAHKDQVDCLVDALRIAFADVSDDFSGIMSPMAVPKSNSWRS